MARALVGIDERLRTAALGAQDYAALALRALRSSVTRPFYWRDAIEQMDRIGVGSLPIILLTGVFTGMVLALQSSIELARFGANIYLGNLVAASMVRELGPVLGALAVAGRAGSGIAAELGSMRVTEQIDAMKSMGTDPIRKLVAPRLVAGLVMLPMLTIVMDLVGILGGLVISVLRVQIEADVYLRGVWNSFAVSGLVLGIIPRDFVSGLIKPVVFGAIITLTGSYYGLAATGGTEGVGRATTRAVVASSMAIFASDYFITQLLLVLLPPQR